MAPVVASEAASAGGSGGSDGPDGRHGPHAFVVDLEAPTLELDDRRHLERVLRIRPGDPLTVSDGAGRWRACAMGGELTTTGPIRTVPPPSPVLIVAFALVKGARPELVVQKLTEMGVDEIVPFTAARSVARWDDAKAGRQLERLTKVAREASMQSRRCHLPVVRSLRAFAEVAALPGAALAERGGRPPSVATTTVLIGPEGGWDDLERAAVVDQVDFGPQVLRAETAALAVAAILAGLRAGVVNERLR
ncbi:MAG TPA: RsmE family RNA methyltransferase [Acidimicrobiales bacterium]